MTLAIGKPARVEIYRDDSIEIATAVGDLLFETGSSSLSTAPIPAIADRSVVFSFSEGERPPVNLMVEFTTCDGFQIDPGSSLSSRCNVLSAEVA